MRNWKGQLFLVALVALALAGSTVTLTTAARKATPQCQKKCSEDWQVCKGECNSEQAVCLDGCKELTGNAQSECNIACNAEADGCDLECDTIKAECKAACPRGNKESPTEPV